MAARFVSGYPVRPVAVVGVVKRVKVEPWP